jgi:ATP-dependent Lon protease
MSVINLQNQKTKTKDQLPVVTLRDTVVFPGSMVHLTVGRTKVKAAIDTAYSGDRLAIYIAQKNPRVETPGIADLYQVGTVGIIRRLWKVDGDYNLAVEGLYRVYLKEYVQQDPYLLSRFEEIPELAERNEKTEALFRNILAKIRRYGEVGGALTLESSISIFSTDDPNQLVNAIAASIEIKATDKQQILEMVDVVKRLERLSDILTREIRILEISQKIGWLIYLGIFPQLIAMILKKLKKF